MARLIKIQSHRTYATPENAIKAVDKKGFPDSLRYFIHRDEETGRYFPIFLGEAAMHAGVHFHFNVAF